ncbi:unnamed protein product, partial [Heterosigma akashiwo]
QLGTPILGPYWGGCSNDRRGAVLGAGGPRGLGVLQAGGAGRGPRRPRLPAGGGPRPGGAGGQLQGPR